MKKKMIKTVFILFCIILLFTNVSYCATSIAPEYNENANVSVWRLNNFGATIAVVIRNSGIIVAVIMLMILGIKYMLGSLEEKATYKKSMIPYLIGCFLLFGAAVIAQIFMNIAKDL